MIQLPIRRRRPWEGVRKTKRARVSRIETEHVIDEVNRVIHTRRTEYTRMPHEITIRELLTPEGKRVLRKAETQKASPKEIQRLKAEIERIKKEAGAK